MPICMIPLPCLPCHVYFSCISFVSMFAFITLFMHCSKVCFLCWQIVFQTCFACIFLTVTPFGVFFICNLISFSCTLCLCYYLMLLTNLKYSLGKNSTKCFNHREALSDMPCLGCASLKLTGTDSLLYASPLAMLV